MSRIVCKLLGFPQILKDDAPVFFPYSKINALLYYMLVTKVGSRDEIAGLIWPEETDETARRNLRNAVYQAKKSIGEDILISPQKSLLSLNQKLDLDLDVDRFLADPASSLSLYEGDFLKGFFLKDSEPYESWVERTRSYYRERFSTECHQKVEKDLKNRNYGQIENYIRKLIELDEYDERNYRALMRFYHETGRNGKVIETYYDLSRFLRHELNIAPDADTRAIYEEALEQMHVEQPVEPSRNESVYYFERLSQIAALEKRMNQFRDGSAGQAAIRITGEPGAGKSAILHRLLLSVKSDFLSLHLDGALSEQAFQFRPWKAAAEDIRGILEDFRSGALQSWNSQVSEIFPDFPEAGASQVPPAAADSAARSRLLQLMFSAVRELSRIRPVLLVIQNVQWMDLGSIRLLCAFLAEISGLRVLPVVTELPSFSRTPDEAHLTGILKTRYDLSELELRYYTAEQCHRLISQELSPGKTDIDLMERIINDTEGNPFLLDECISQLRQGEPLNLQSERITAFLRANYLFANPGQEELAAVFSCLQDPAPLKFAAAVLKRPESSLLDPLDCLLRQGVLKEKEGQQEILLSLSHGFLKSCINSALSASRRRLLNQRISEEMEKRYLHTHLNSQRCSSLAFYFHQAGNLQKALRYKIASLNCLMNYSHEIFPMLETEELQEEPGPFYTSARSSMIFSKLEAELQALESLDTAEADLENLKLEFFYMRGRFYILDGHYEAGVSDIHSTIERAKRNHSQKYLFEGYKQLIFYYIQIADPAGMERYLDLAFDLADRANDFLEICILLRLQGVCRFMQGNYDSAETLLQKSIDMMTLTSSMAGRYALNIAGCYYYLAEIKMNRSDLDASLRYFEKAISLCPNSAILSLTLLYIGAGKVSYFLHDEERTRKYIVSSSVLSHSLDSFWRQSTLEACVALLSFTDRKYEDCIRHLNRARDCMQRFQNPTDRGFVHFAETILRMQVSGIPALQKTFEKVLPESYRYYCQLALNHLDSNMDRCEISRLRELIYAD